jgi:hypothetical protein
MSTSAPQPDNAAKVEPAPQVAGDPFHKGWRQVRLFTRDVNHPNWYPQLLGSVVKPLFQQNPETIFFLSRYVCRLNEDDDGDTDISQLPKDFLFPAPEKKQVHFGIRLRFQPKADEENTLATVLKARPDCWLCKFLDFGMPGGLADKRFATAQDNDSQVRRGRLTAELLCANSRLILDSLVCKNGQWTFETNDHELNRPFGLAAKSSMHMIVNPWSLNDSKPLPIFFRFNNNGFAPL